MTKADEIRKEIQLKRKQLGHYASFIKNKMTDLLFRELAELNLKLSNEIERENAVSQEEYIYSGTKSFDEDAKEVDDKQRYKDWRNEQ
jgi:hypothetical protein